MSFRDDALLVLSGGLPALLEFGAGDPAAATTVPTVPVEQVKPEPTNRDTENLLENVTQTQILSGTAIIIAVIAIVFLFRKA